MYELFLTPTPNLYYFFISKPWNNYQSILFTSKTIRVAFPNGFKAIKYKGLYELQNDFRHIDGFAEISIKLSL